MFALIAAVIFLLELLGIHLGNVNMTVLGLMFVALALAFGGLRPWVRSGQVR